jgi:hypothetical protein
MPAGCIELSAGHANMSAEAAAIFKQAPLGWLASADVVQVLLGSAEMGVPLSTEAPQLPGRKQH